MRKDDTLGYGMARPTKKQWQLVENNLGLVYTYLSKCPPNLPKHIPKEDIIHDILLPATIRAAKAYDPDRGFTFATYAWKTCRYAMVSARLKMAQLLPIAREQITDWARHRGHEGHSGGLDPQVPFQEPLCKETIIELLLSKLSPPRRDVIEMYYFGEQLKDRQSAELLGISKTEMCKRRHQALHQLQKIAAAHNWTITDFI